MARGRGDDDDDEGVTVPFIVCQETGYSLRDPYKIAALWDPKLGEPNPTSNNPGFADKLVLDHGTSCDTYYESGEATDVLYEETLAQGFVVASHALDNAGHNCNLITQAESLIMVKEMVVERFGPLRYSTSARRAAAVLTQARPRRAVGRLSAQDRHAKRPPPRQPADRTPPGRGASAGTATPPRPMRDRTTRTSVRFVLIKGISL